MNEADTCRKYVVPKLTEAGWDDAAHFIGERHAFRRWRVRANQRGTAQELQPAYRDEEFADCIAWWGKRKQNDQAWKVKAADVLKYDDEGRLLSCNLDLKNPNSAEALEHRPPQELVSEIIEKEQRILAIMQEIQAELGEKNR